MSTIVISGAGRGIGLELTRRFRARGDDVIALCRRGNDDLGALGARIIEDIEVRSGASMAQLKDELGNTRIDVLINNAGILTRDSLDHLDFEAMRAQYEINTLGPLRLTATLLDNLHEGSKIAIVTSRMGSITDNGSGGYYGYRASKAAVNIIGVSLARDLEPRGIAVCLLHPGMVATDMTGHNGIPVTESASGLITRIDELSLSNTGRWWHANGESLPW